VIHWYWGTWRFGRWFVTFDLRSWLLGWSVYLGDVEVYIGPVSFGYSDVF
jgi:hypothetical protein